MKFHKNTVFSTRLHGVRRSSAWGERGCSNAIEALTELK
jgi:hypothetical protein